MGYRDSLRALAITSCSSCGCGARWPARSGWPGSIRPPGPGTGGHSSRLWRPDREAAPYGKPLTVGVLDLDNSKMVNDTLGHAAADDALRAVVGVLRRDLRAVDTVARWAATTGAAPTRDGRGGSDVRLGKLQEGSARRCGREEWPISFSAGVIVDTELPGRSPRRSRPPTSRRTGPSALEGRDRHGDLPGAGLRLRHRPTSRPSCQSLHHDRTCSCRPRDRPEVSHGFTPGLTSIASTHSVSLRVPCLGVPNEGLVAPRADTVPCPHRRGRAWGPAIPAGRPAPGPAPDSALEALESPGSHQLRP